MKLGHKGHLNTKNKFSKEVFPKSNDFSSDFGWTQKPSFRGGDEEKSMKSKELELWIHSKVGGRWWGLSCHPYPWKESKKNSSKLTDEKSGKNTPKITKKKNDPFNLVTRLTHKD
jgi:hypothetical protein